jgi:hypothetical protein
MLAPDTNAKAHDVQVAAWRRMGPAGRSRAMAELSESLRRTVRDQLAAAHPGWTREQLQLALLERLHGRELASRVLAVPRVATR